MNMVYLALGSNVGDSKQNIQRAIELLGEHISSVQHAPIYVSTPLGGVEQANFLNTAISGETELSARELFFLVKKIEKDLGRIERVRNGPREIDIDIIFYGNETIDEPDLSIPHVGLAERDFVLRPLCDLDPELIDPRSGKKVSTLLGEVPDANWTLSGEMV